MSETAMKTEEAWDLAGKLAYMDQDMLDRVFPDSKGCDAAYLISCYKPEYIKQKFEEFETLHIGDVIEIKNLPEYAGMHGIIIGITENKDEENKENIRILMQDFSVIITDEENCLKTGDNAGKKLHQLLNDI